MDMNMGFVVTVIMTLLASSAIAHGTSTNVTKGQCRAGTGELRCCSMYYPLNETCQECAPGTYRFLDDNESNCKKCKKGNFGRFCSYTCNCKNYSCDPVDGTCKCESGNVECNKEGDEADPSHGPDRNNYVAIIVPVLLVLFLMLLVCTVSWIRAFCLVILYKVQKLYKQFVLQEGENGRTRQLEDSTTISCITYYTNKLRVKLTPASVVFDPDNHDEYGFDDGHYCSIRESAMIRPLNQGNVSLYIEDGSEDDKYNHLNPKIERKITDVYLNNGNIYTKIQNVQSGKQTTVTLPNYDRMELNKVQH